MNLKHVQKRQVVVVVVHRTRLRYINSPRRRIKHDSSEGVEVEAFLVNERAEVVRAKCRSRFDGVRRELALRDGDEIIGTEDPRLQRQRAGVRTGRADVRLQPLRG